MNAPDLEKMNDFSDIISLVASILSVQSSLIEKNERIKTRERIATNIDIIVAFLVTMAAFIELSVAKKEYEEILKKNINNKKSKELTVAKDLLTSRVFSCLASIFLVKSILLAASIDESIPFGVVPV